MKNNMKSSSILLGIILLIASSCAEKSPNSDNYQKDSLCTVKETNFDDIDEESENSNNNEKEEDMVDISDLFSSEELDKIRFNFISQLRFEFKSFSIGYEMAPLSEAKDKDFINHEISDEEKSENMDVIYRILLKNHPIFKPVSKELFEEKMKKVFDIDINDRTMRGTSFFTNHSMENKFDYTTYIDLKNHIVTFGNLPLMFKKEMDWDGFYKKLENLDQESIEYYDTEVSLYKEYLNEASQKKYSLYCSKKKLEYLFHINNYVFYDSQASLSWLLSKESECIAFFPYTQFTDILFYFFNYDKEPRINRNNFRFDISKGFPLKSDRYKSLFGEVESCSQTQYYNHFKFKVRTGMMQYVVDNCYDETDLDTFGIRKDKLICIMEDCFDYLFEYVLKGDEYKESEGKYYEGQYGHYESYGCHYYQVCAYLAYYLTKAHEKFVSYGHGDPRCWHNALVNNLREDLKNNDARFENYVKENNYFNLDGFEQIMKDAHEQAMIEQ